MRGDTPFNRLSLERMTDDELDAMLQVIRERRLQLVKQMQEQEAAKHAAQRELIVGKVSKQFDMLAKELAKVDSVIDKVATRIMKIRALRLEMDW